MSEWKPIETAPRDGTNVLLTSDFICVDDTTPAIWMAYWPTDADSPWCFRSSWDYEPLPDATHWMPLPPPPVTRQIDWNGQPVTVREPSRNYPNTETGD